MIVDDDEIREFTCFTCRKRFPLISDLTKHLKTEHTLASFVDEGDGGGGEDGGVANVRKSLPDRESDGGEGDDGPNETAMQVALTELDLMTPTPPGQREKKFFCGYVFTKVYHGY